MDKEYETRLKSPTKGAPSPVNSHTDGIYFDRFIPSRSASQALVREDAAFQALLHGSTLASQQQQQQQNIVDSPSPPPVSSTSNSSNNNSNNSNSGVAVDHRGHAMTSSTTATMSPQRQASLILRGAGGVASPPRTLLATTRVGEAQGQGQSGDSNAHQSLTPQINDGGSARRRLFETTTAHVGTHVGVDSDHADIESETETLPAYQPSFLEAHSPSQPQAQAQPRPQPQHLPPISHGVNDSPRRILTSPPRRNSPRRPVVPSSGSPSPAATSSGGRGALPSHPTTTTSAPPPAHNHNGTISRPPMATDSHQNAYRNILDQELFQGMFNPAPSSPSMQPPTQLQQQPQHQQQQQQQPPPPQQQQQQQQLLNQSPSSSGAADARHLLYYTSSPTARYHLEKKGSTSPYSLSPLSSESARLLAAPRKTQRTISSLPFRVLEAPFIQDDFYLNLVDWGQCNVMAVGLGQSVYLWNAANASVSRLCKLGHNNHVTSVLWLDPPPGSRVGGSGSGSSSTNTTFHSSPLSPRPPRPMEGFGSDVGVGVTGTEDSSLAPLQTNTHKSSEALSNFLAVGDNYGNVLLYDSTTLRKVHQWSGHRDRVGALAFNQDRGLLTSGSRDRQILLYDTRAPNVIFSTSSPSAPTTTATTKLSGHRQEVCGLKWAPQHTMSDQLASGGNDNRLFIWDARALREPVLSMTHHIAAVKAIAWSPHQRGLLASGGGTADRCIRFWNTITPPSAPTASSSTAAIFPSSGGLEGRTASTATIGTPLPLATIDGGSQVCNLAWSRNTNEIVSTHGFSQNQITIWSYPSMQQLASLTGHTTRVLYLAMSPDGQNIVTAAGDETLRFWNVFPPNKR